MLLTPHFHRRLPRALLALALIALIETVIMLALDRLLPEDTTPLWLNTAADVLALTLLAAPIFWWLFVHPSRTALEESEENTHALLDAIEESALLLSPDGTVLAINQTGARRLGQTPHAMVGRPLWDFLPPDVSATRSAQLGEAVRTARAVVFEDTRAGRSYRITLHPIAGPRGVRLVAAYAQDTTESRRLAAMERLLREADEYILRGASSQTIMTFICEQVAREFGFALAWFGQREQNGGVRLVAAAGPATALREELMAIGVRWDDSATGRGPTGSAIRLARMQITRVDAPDFRPWVAAARQHGLTSAASLPLVIRGEIWGAFTVYATQPEAFEDAQLRRVLEHIAARAAVALEASFQQEELRLLSTALARAANAVFITDREGRIQWVNEAFSRLSGYSAAEAIGATPRLLKSGVHDAAYYEKLWSTILAGEVFTSQTTERRKDGSLYTVRQIITPIRNEEGAITHFIATHEDISDALAAQARIEHMAHFDAVTGLPNRSLFFDRLKQALARTRRNGEKLALFFLDLDRFKPVNDRYGHAVGDALLAAVAERLTRCVRESDTVARIAGDEFTVLLPGITGREDAARVAAKILKAIGEPFQEGGHTLHIGASIGIALFPDDAADGEALLRCADDAMYQAKAAGRNTYRFHRDAPAN
ncbi:diguanylate cyclase domain-containing protein [Thiobacter aerophilum]|uniref:Diguanylate cyclase n=1 Tax=Thiobacter aerophilum TaxID=3121275 RepID=A0ABV0EFW3_9BURK